jgi:tetratricopeptide (TPR) repeat protein
MVARHATACHAQGDVDTALDDYEQVLALFTETGDPVRATMSFAGRAAVLFDAGRFSEALESLERAAEAVPTNPRLRPFLDHLRAWILALSGEPEDALELARATEETARAFGDADVTSGCIAVQAAVAARQGQRADADALLARGLEEAPEGSLMWRRLSRIAEQLDHLSRADVASWLEVLGPLG